jgi:NADPH:quinone reductase-like Zn-dependent oxidoreductase
VHVVGVGGARSAELLRGVGADETFDYARGPEALRTKYGGRDATKFDFVFDTVGGELFRAAVEGTLRHGGAVLHVRNRGDEPAFVARGEAAGRDATGPRWHSIIVRPSGAQLAEISALFDAGKLRLNVAHTLPLEEVAKAHELVESGHAGGKVVLKVS